MEMVYGGDPTDVEFANEIGARIGDQLLRAPRWLGVLGFRLNADVLVERVVREIQRFSPSTVPLDRRAPRGLIKRTYRSSVVGVQRLVHESRRMGLDGIPVLADEGGPLRGLTPVDLFNRRAMETLFAHTERSDIAPTFRDALPLSPAWRDSVRRIVPGVPWVRTVDERTAARGFVTFLANAARALIWGYGEEGQSGVDFRVWSGEGYNIDSFEEFCYSPKAFGTKRSYPVDGPLPFGFYRFQGWKDSFPIIDRRRYEVSPVLREATMQDF